MITTASPSNWRELQTMVADILSECGFVVEVEKVITGARGETEIDVFAEETIKGRLYTVLVECKHWASRIPQTVIHAFRTVLADTGANAGYIVSSAGFQSGSQKAAQLSNVRLVTWREFQDEFEETWFDQFFSPQIAERFDEFMTYTEPIHPSWVFRLSDSDAKEFQRLWDKHLEVGVLCLALSPYARMISEANRPSLPLMSSLSFGEQVRQNLPAGIFESQGWKEVLGALTVYVASAVDEFRELRARSGTL